MLYSEFETKCYFKLVKMSYLTESLKIEILMMIGYGDRARTQCEVVRLFRETHPDLPPLNQGTISKIEAQYREMGHVRKVPSKRQAVVDDDTKLNLLLALEENPIAPARQLARDSNLNHKTVLKILKYEKKRPYKMQVVQELLEDDPDRRVIFTHVHIVNNIGMKIQQNNCLAPSPPAYNKNTISRFMVWFGHGITDLYTEWIG
ncbi:hypothetical protein NQ318_007017, partial [Aromia moschata]